jgi:hypothetical protein
MCSKHDDPSMIDEWRVSRVPYNGTVGLYTSLASEVIENIGNSCDYDCWTRELLVYPYTITHVHNWLNHRDAWNLQSEKSAEARRGANEMRHKAYNNRGIPCPTCGSNSCEWWSPKLISRKFSTQNTRSTQ